MPPSSFVNQAQAAANTATYPTGIQAGDLILYFGWRNTTTAPSLPTGFTNITNGSGNANAYRLCWKRAVGTESGTASPTFTNANGVIIAVYRDAHAIGDVNDGPHAAATTAAFLALSAYERGNGSSSTILFIGSKQTTSTSTPAGTTLRGSVQNVTSGSIAMFDILGATSFAGANSTLGASATHAVISVEIKRNQKAEALYDNFDDNSLDSNKWGTFTDTGITIAETNQELEITNTGANATYGGLIGAAAGGVDLLDLTGSHFYLRVKDVGAQTWASKEIEIHMLKDGANANDLFFLIGDGSGSADTLYAYRRVGGTNTVVASATYNSTNHVWLCISEGNGRPGASGRTAGTIYWDYAPDDGTGNPGTWSNLGSWAASFEFVNMQPQIDFGHWQVEATPASIIAKIDNVNVGTPVAGAGQNFFF